MAETITIDIVANFVNKTSAGSNAAKQSVDRVAKAARDAKREADRLSGTNARPRISVVDRATSTLNKVNSGLRSIGGKTVRAGVKIIDYATRPLRAIKNSLFSIKGLVAAIGTGWAANQLIMKPIGLADQYSSAKIGFSTLLGDTGGQKLMNDLDKFAKATPFKTSNTISQAQKMIAMGWDAKNIVKDMTTIGDAAAATGKGDEGLQRIVLALAQIKSKGKLSTEELNQLAEAGISAKRYLAEGLGYGSGDSALMKMSKDLEKGAIGSEAAIKAIMKGMKEYKGMMDKTANETVEGLKSQIEDTFEINIFRKWGQGLQDGAKRGLGSIVKLLDRSEGSLEKFGDTVYEIGKDLSNWTADKLEGTIDKILEVSNSKAFKEASFGGKIAIMWDKVIAEPFGEWWDSKGKPYVAKKMGSLGKGLGSGLSKSLMALLGVDVVGIAGESASIGGSFASGFAKGFESKKVWSAIVKAAGRAFKTGFTSFFTGGALEKIIVGSLAVKITSGILNGITKAQTLWAGTGELVGGGVGGLGTGGAMTLSGMGLKGIIGSTGNAVVNGSGILGMLASVGYKMKGSSMLAGNLGGVGMSGLSAAGVGLATVSGAAGGIAGAVNAIGDLTRTIQANSNNDRNLYGTRAGVKAGMVGTGALVGSIFGPVGTAVGAGLGGIATYLAGNKLADAISGVSKSTAELNAEAEKLASKQMAKRFGDITLSAEELSQRVSDVFGEKTISRVNKFNQSMADLQTAQTALSEYKDTVDYTHARIMGKEKLAESDITSYKEALDGYSSATKQLLSANKSTNQSAFKLLWGDDTKGLQAITKNMNKTYTGLEKQLSERSAKLNDVMAKAFEDGKITIDEEKKINEVVKQIEDIQRKIEERLQKKKKYESEESYNVLGDKYKDTNLTPDSFKSLISELDKQGEIDMKAYDNARIKAKAELKLELEEGTISQKEYDKAIKKVEAKWRKGKAITVKQKVNVSLEVLKTNYSKEFAGIQEKLSSDKLFSDNQILKLKKSTTGTGLRGESIGTVWNKNSKIEFASMKDSFLKSAGVSKAAQKELSDMYKSLQPQEKDLQELKKSYEKAGEEVPKWIEESLADISNIKLMSGDMNSFYKIIGEQIAKDDPSYAKALKDAKAKGQKVPQALIDGINEGMKGDVNVKKKANVDVDAKTKTENAKKKSDSKTKKDLGKSKKVNKKASVNVKADTKTKGAKDKANKKTKSDLGKPVSTKKTGTVNVNSKTTGTGAAADKAKQEFKAPVDQRFGTSISENGKVKVSSVSLSGAGAAIASAWETFKGWVKDKFKNSVDVTSNVRVNTVKSGGTGGGKKKKQSANGGYVDKAITTLVGEAGPEMIIPLSANRRQRGKSLWEQAGRAMGIMQNADGGLYGTGSSKLADLMNSANSVGRTGETQKQAVTPVKVDVGGITLTIQSSGNGVAQDIQQNADTISGQIADILQKAFQNMPLTAGEA